MNSAPTVLKHATPIQPHTPKVSYVRRSQSLKSQRQSLTTKRKRSSNVIHITVRSLPRTDPTDDNSVDSKNIPLTSSMQYEVRSSSITQNSTVNPTDTTSLSTHQNISENEDLDRSSTYMNNDEESKQQNNSNVLMNQTDFIENHHRKELENKNYQHICLYVGLFLCLLFVVVLLVIIAIMGILLSKKPAATVIPSINPSLRWNPAGITIAGTAGVSGANSTLLYYPYGLAFDSSNILYIADIGNHRIQKLITNTSMCVTVAGDPNGSFGSAANRLKSPVDILFDSNDNMYIADRANTRVQFWAKGATSGTTIAGTGGTSNISLAGPSSIRADPSFGTLYIADTFNHRIISYPGGTVVAGGNGPGNAETNLYNPYGFVYDSVSRSFVIANYNTNNIVRWALGATNRTHVAGSIAGTSGSTSTSLYNPVGVTMDPMGNIYVADSDNHRIQFFPAGQSNATTIIGTTGVSGTNSDQLFSPYWVILDNQLNLYVSDTFNNRVQKYLRY